MQKTLTQLTIDLCKIRSIDTPEHYSDLKEVVDFVEKRVKKLPGVYMKRFLQNHKHSLVVTFKKEHKTPTVFLNGHLDVVPGDDIQFTPKLKGHKLIGRGPKDMKGGCAVMMALIEYFAKQKEKPDVGFIFVTDEETSGQDGSHMLYKKGYRPKLHIAMEPSNLDLIVETKGPLGLRGVIPGKACHGSKPWEGISPIELFHQSLAKLYKLYPPLKRKRWQTTCNIGQVHAGDCCNRTPPDLMFELDIRYVAEDDPKKIMKRVKACFPKNTNWTVLRLDPPHPKAKDMSLIHQLKKTATSFGLNPKYVRGPWASDNRFFAPYGIPSVEFGAMGGGEHGPDEWLDVRSLVQVYEVMKQFLTTF